MTALNVGIVTKEWPPAIYGGAGVHVLQLTQALRTIKDVHVDVHCFGGTRTDALVIHCRLVLSMQILLFKHLPSI